MNKTVKEKKAEKTKKQTTINIKPKININQESNYETNTEDYDSQEYNYFKLRLKNACLSKLSVSIVYLGIDDDWIVEGWFNLSGGEDLMLDIKVSSNSIVYFYAENQLATRFWDGRKDETKAIGSYTIDDSFKYIRSNNNSLIGEKTYRTYFANEDSPNNGVLTQTFYCPSSFEDKITEFVGHKD